jgi:uncharacterized protein
MLIARDLAPILKKAAKQMPVVSLVGPRQSGKSTLCQACFPDYQYLNLNDLEQLRFAHEDPKGFLQNCHDHVIIDEAQMAPDLFHYIQNIADKKGTPGQFILTGAQNFLLTEKITQSLAGRTRILQLLPLSLRELSKAKLLKSDYETYLWQGFYPRLYQYELEPQDWYPSYLMTYVQRDVRQMKNIQNLTDFQHFLMLCAARIGQSLNLSDLANDCQISVNTAKAWLSLLEASYIIYRLRPYYKNFNKRITKMPKLYFIDPGLASSLLGISSQTQLETHQMKGHLFENLIINELLKNQYNAGLEDQLYFWRDSQGHEVDAIIEQGGKLNAIEIKSGKTIQEKYFDGLKRFQALANNEQNHLIYGGNASQKRQLGTVLPWDAVNDVF